MERPGAGQAADERVYGGLIMHWIASHRFDKRALPIADRHYNRRKPGSPQFVAPGKCVVLVSRSLDAVWVTSWPKAEFVQHAWPGAWINSCFRNESPILSSLLIREAISATLHKWPTPPELGLISFVNSKKVRRKRDPGRCFIRAGFKFCGMTKGGLHAFQMLPHEMPESAPY
jgi:hypothetical protein